MIEGHEASVCLRYFLRRQKEHLIPRTSKRHALPSLSLRCGCFEATGAVGAVRCAACVGKRRGPGAPLACAPRSRLQQLCYGICDPFVRAGESDRYRATPVAYQKNSDTCVLKTRKPKDGRRPSVRELNSALGGLARTYKPNVVDVAAAASAVGASVSADASAWGDREACDAAWVLGGVGLFSKETKEREREREREREKRERERDILAPMLDDDDNEDDDDHHPRSTHTHTRTQAANYCHAKKAAVWMDARSRRAGDGPTPPAHPGGARSASAAHERDEENARGGIYFY